jgi:hypothetical protein
LHAFAWCLLACTFGCAGAPRSRPEPGLDQRIIVVPELRRELERVAQGLHESGFRELGPALSGFLLAGSHATLSLRIPAGRCVTVVVRATSGARDVDAALYAADGRLLALDSATSAHPTVQACAVDQEERAYYVIQFYEGDGSFVALPFYGPRSSLRAAAAAVGGKPAFVDLVAVPEVAENPASAFAEGLRKRGYDPVGEPRRFVIAQGERVRASLPVEAGQCYTVASFGGPGINSLRLRLLDEQGAAVSVAADERPEAATQLCARTNAIYSLESEATAGAGDVLVLVYRVDVVTAGGDAGLWLGHRAPGPEVSPAAKSP